MSVIAAIDPEIFKSCCLAWVDGLWADTSEVFAISGASPLIDGAWAVNGYLDLRPFRGPIGWIQKR